MRVLVAPDKYAGTLSAREAAEAIASGWQRTAPHDELVLAPLSDGGPGFVDVLHACLGGELLVSAVRGPLGALVPAALLRVGTDAYVESAQACGLHLLPPSERDLAAASTFGVGELVGAAVAGGARRVVVGLGGSGTNDGGAGLLAALGAEPAAQLQAGGAALAGLSQLDLEPVRRSLGGTQLWAACDVDNPLLGLRGASAVFGPQKGATPAGARALDAALARFADLADSALAERPGAGAGGGLGYGLLLAGAHLVGGIDTVLNVLDFDALVRAADLVLSGEGAFDAMSLRGKVVSGVARAAQTRGRPAVVLAGRVEVGRREMAAIGVEAAYAVMPATSGGRALPDRPAEELAELAARVARTWSTPRP